MADSKLATTPPPCTGSSSPPPNCAICLGTCTNKCFSDSCMHEFCFKCLLEWSKIKAECPLCKQAFKSIIHNIKSIDEYDEHIVETIAVEENRYPDPFHQYHFRTTFTVDTHGEHALQQMLLRHPLLHIGTFSPERYPHRRRRGDTSATTFRRSIYNRNLWVYAPPDITGRYRDCSPSFFRNNPAARTRLAPWLNRELNALLYENTQQVMHLVDVIMDHLLRHHIYSYMFRSLLTNFLGNKTDHFIHEFYNFMRSPFDMIGYDRYVIYTERRPSPIPYIDISDYDRDVILVSDTDDNNAEQQPVTDSVIINLDTDSDEPIIVSEERHGTATTQCPSSATQPEGETGREPVVLPLKVRLKKSRRKSKAKRTFGVKRTYYVVTSSSSSSSCSSSSSLTESSSTSSSLTASSSDSDYEHRRQQQKQLLKRLTKNKKRKELKLKIKSEERAPPPPPPDDSSDDEDNIPLLNLARRRKKSKSSTKPHSKKRKINECSSSSVIKSDVGSGVVPLPNWLSSNSSIKAETKTEPYFSENSNGGRVDAPTEVPQCCPSECNLATEHKVPTVKSKIRDLRNQDDRSKAGPSKSKHNLGKKEDAGSYWYARPPYVYESDDSSDN